jgi:hypothetical protein
MSKRLEWLDQRRRPTDADVKRFERSTRFIRAIDKALQEGTLTPENEVRFLRELGVRDGELDAWVELVEVHAAAIAETKRLMGASTP